MSISSNGIMSELKKT
ncbi:uncharacterized, partial [Tachysurus ichikawai]